MPMTQVASYIGDDAFKAFLSEHGCRSSFEEIRMRFLGAQVSPGRDADIYLLVEDLFEYDMPEHGTTEKPARFNAASNSAGVQSCPQSARAA
jgi:hypothetical protein